MFQLISVDLDRMQELQSAMSRPVVYCTPQSDLVIDRPPLAADVITIEDIQFQPLQPAPRILTAHERLVLDRAFWRSVEIIDDGFEG